MMARSGGVRAVSVSLADRLHLFSLSYFGARPPESADFLRCQHMAFRPGIAGNRVPDLKEAIYQNLSIRGYLQIAPD